MKILVINCGSSSLKYQLIDMENEEVLAKGNYERIGTEGSFVTHKVGNEKYRYERDAKNHEEAISFVLEQFTDSEHGVISSLDDITAIGHRTVHGGEKFNKSVLITDETIEAIRECIPLAPLHNPAGLTGIEACKKVMPGKPMVAVFDTAFHQTIPKERYIYPIPYKYYEKYGLRKYGFHGTSHRYVSSRLAQITGKPIENMKTIVCHLGQGASLCAVDGGKSVDTSMGFTPLAGITMGTRSGDLDPSVVTFLMKKENLTVDEIDNILNKESGVFGISGISSDFRDIEKAAEEGNEKALLTRKAYCYNVAQFVAKYGVSMNGIDNIVFTAGIGENQVNIRKMICDNLKWLGVEIDDEKNSIRGEEIKISTDDSKINVWVIPTNEELVIARDTLDLIK